MKYFFIISKIVSIALLFHSFLFAQFPSSIQFRSKSIETPPNFNYVAKKPGHSTAKDWQTVIDTTWGEGLPTETKLQLFNDAWNTINAKYACFQNLDIDLDALKDLYLPEIEAGVSRGRFAAIMNYMGLALQETHTFILDIPICRGTPLEPGVPLFVIGVPGRATHFGAALSPLPDSSLLVIKSLPDHPLGLVLGDIVLGYDGIPWKNLYKEILEAQLPISFSGHPVSTLSAQTHNYLISAGMNWHLFDTLDVVQYSPSDTLHYPTHLLAGQTGFIWGNEQLPVPGVPWLDIDQGDDTRFTWDFDRYVSWGIVKDTQIGYIYLVSMVRDLVPDVGVEFYNAIDTLMNHYPTTGLILDIRLNIGGNTFVDDAGLSLLFNSYIKTTTIKKRCVWGDPNDHFQMCRDPWWTDDIFAIKGDPKTFFDKPIAVLTGPGALSMGDQFSLRMKYHPMARLFGKSPAGAFSIWDTNVNHLPHPDWWFGFTEGNSFLIDNPDSFITHTDLPVDEEVWFTQEDVAKGEDTVVKRAIEWINNLAYAHDVAVNKIYAQPGIDSVIVTTQVENPNQHELSITAYLNNMNGVTVDSLKLFDDGDHGDGGANDNLWGNFYLPVDEQSFKISVTTNDLTEETSRTLPNVAWFTTIGPVVLDHFEFTSIDTVPNPGDQIKIRMFLRNDGSVETASNITAKLTSLDTGVTVRTIPALLPYVEYGDIGADEISESARDYLISFNGPFDKYYYEVPFALDIRSGDYSFWIDTTSIVVDIDQKGKPIPEDFALYQNYPNPFNPNTVIRYALPVTCHLELSIYNILGQKVATLVNKKQPAGTYSVEWEASGFAGGVYFYRLTTDTEFSETRKLLYLK